MLEVLDFVTSLGSVQCTEDLQAELKIPSEVHLTDMNRHTCHRIMKIWTLERCYMRKMQPQYDIKEYLLNVATQTSDTGMFILSYLGEQQY